MSETRIDLDQIDGLSPNQTLEDHLSNLNDNVGFIKGQVANVGALSSLSPVQDMHVFVKADNKWVRYNGSTWVDITASNGGGGGGGATNLDGLTDVTISNPSNGQALIYNGSVWVNGTVSGGSGGGTSNLDDLTDVAVSSPSNGQVLKYNGTTWVNTGISISNISGLQSALESKANSSSLGTASTKNVGTSVGNVPELDADGKLSTSILPAIAITDTFEVSSENAMLALTAEKGDVAIRSDLSKSFILANSPSSTLSNWKELKTPTDTVLSVNGKTGTVSLSAVDVGAEPTISSKGTAFNKDFGSSAGTVAEGNHTHTFASLTSKPTTLSGYGITDAATIASPNLTGTPAAPTQNINDNSTKLATTEFVHEILEEYQTTETITYDVNGNITKQTVVGETSADANYTVDYVYTNASTGQLNYSEKTYSNGGNTIKVRKTYTYNVNGYITGIVTTRTITTP